MARSLFRQVINPERVDEISSPSGRRLRFMHVIDIHIHPIFYGDGGTRRAVRALEARGRTFGIERMVALGDVLAHGRDPTAAQVRAINDDTARVVRYSPGYFIGFCFLNPRLGERAVIREVERCVGGLGFRGIKLEICNNARDACMRPVMRAAAQFDVPVLQHSWSQTNIRQRRYHSDPEDTCLLAHRFPNVRVIMAHLTGCGYRGIMAARGLDNLWIDTSGAAPEAGLIEYAVAQLGAHRILYGSDLPIRDLPVAIGRIAGSDISPEAQRAILHDNAARLLKLA
jgi:uncharacterized protein